MIERHVPKDSFVANLGIKSLETPEGHIQTVQLDHEESGLNQVTWTCGFAAVGSSIISEDFLTPKVTGSFTFNQGSSLLNILSGTTANSEFLTRSQEFWNSSLRFRAGLTISQRIANNNFEVLLADLIGEDLAFTINSATSVTVTLPNHRFNATNIGQSMLIGGISLLNAVPGYYAIASIPNANQINFTVAGWPSSGTGTLTLFGYNHIRNLFTGTTATIVSASSQRRGWRNTPIDLTINTTASPGTIIQNEVDGRTVYFGDTLRASTASPNITSRGSFQENIPDDDVKLYVFIWAYNGTVAPASTTTFSLSFVSVDHFQNIPVYLQGIRPQGSVNSLPVAVQGTPSVTVGAAAASIAKAEDAVASSGDTGVFVLGVRRDAATTSASAAADYNELAVNRFGAAYTAGFRTHTRTYSGSANITVAAAATDIAAIFGNATTTVQVTKIRVTGIQTTTGTVDFHVIMRSTANTGGTSSNFSVARHEIADAVNFSTPILYTANPTTGTAAGIVRRFYLPLGSAASGLSQEYTLEFGDNGKPIILSGTAQGLVINLNGATVTGGIINVSIEWIEF